MDKLYYLATPYTHDDPKVRAQRYEMAVEMAGDLLASGLLVYSPIAHTHPIALAKELPKGWEFWKRYDECFIDRCDGVIVGAMDGWDTSKGVTAEIEMARGKGKPVWYLPYPLKTDLYRWFIQQLKEGAA